MEPSPPHRRYHLRKSRHNFEAQAGDFDQMCDLLCAAVHSGGNLWERFETVEIELRTICLNPILQMSSCSDGAGTFDVLSIRERALIGRLLRFFAARPVMIEELSPKSRRKQKRVDVGVEWTESNPYVVLAFEPPSMHEKMEATELLREWLRQNWPEGEKHLARVF